jgi:hypothetical protein
LNGSGTTLDDTAKDLTITDPFQRRAFRNLRQLGPIKTLSLRQRKYASSPRLTAKLAEELAAVEVDWLWLWLPVSRAALSQCLHAPGLREITAFELTRPGKLRDFAVAKTLKELRIPIARNVDEADLAMIARAPLLRILSAQQCKLTPRAIDILSTMPCLTDLDIESTGFNDAMAERLAHNRTITKLEIGATDLTGVGLAHLCRMSQLRELDIWATDITLAELPLLEQLPQLEYLSIGLMSRPETFDPDGLVAQLRRLPALKNLWLDGVQLDQHHIDTIITLIPAAKISIAEET